MQNGRIFSWFLLSLILSFGVCSCANHPNKKTIIQMINNGYDGLYRIETQQELKESYENLLDDIVEYLDANGGYRYDKESEEFKMIKEQFDLYNVSYIGSFSRFRPEYNYNTGDRDKWVELFVIMQLMEENRLTTVSN